MNPEIILGHDRNISLLDYFEKLQLEYIVADLRQRIYRKPKDKEFYSKLKEKKKVKILDIAERNHFPTIFDTNEHGTEYRKTMREKIFPEWGLPVFIYADQDQLLKFQFKDITYYFYRGVDVRVRVNKQTQIGKIKFFDYNKEEIHVKLRNSEEVCTFGIDDVSRIL